MATTSRTKALLRFIFAYLLCLALNVSVLGDTIVVVVKQPAAGGPTYLLQTDCEDAGTPTGWTNGSWDVTSGTLIHGAEYAQWTNNVFADFTASSEAWVFIAFRLTSSGPAFQLRNTTTVLAKFNRLATGALRGYNADDSEIGATSTSMGSGIIYLWVRYKKGTGANGEVDVYISTTTTKPGSPEITSTAAKATLDFNRFHIDDEGFGLTRDADDILVDDANIGTNPWSR